MSSSAPRSAFDSSFVNTNIISVPPPYPDQQQKQLQSNLTGNYTIINNANYNYNNYLKLLFLIH